METSELPDRPQQPLHEYLRTHARERAASPACQIGRFHMYRTMKKNSRVSVNIALPGNAMTATDMGYHVVVPEDCIAGSDAATHAVLVEQQLRLLATMSTAADVAAAIS